MGKRDELNELIYEYYESRILFGIYKYGKQLKPVPQVYTLFRMARDTIQIVFGRLEENEYIKTEKRKVARIVYRGSEGLFRENVVAYFALRKEGIQGVRFSGNLVFSSIWEEGIQNLKQGLQRNPGGTKTAGQTTSEPIRLYVGVLDTPHNELLLGLFWQNMRYISYFYPPRNDRKASYAVEGLLSAENANRLKEETDAYYYNVYLDVMEFIGLDRKTYHLEHETQILFVWTVYRKWPQVRCTLASTIIREVLWDVYPVGSYLPSLPKIAEWYHVSLITVCRTLDVLNSLGVARTYIGIGTKICPESIDIDIMGRPEIRENLRPRGEAIQMLALTVRNATHHTLESVKRERSRELLQTIRMLHDKNDSVLCIDAFLNFISGKYPSASLREIYGKLRELVVWGYIFSAVLMAAGQMEASSDNLICWMEDALQTGNPEIFAGLWQLFVEEKLNSFYKKFPLWNTQGDRFSPWQPMGFMSEALAAGMHYRIGKTIDINILYRTMSKLLRQ